MRPTIAPATEFIARDRQSNAGRRGSPTEQCPAGIRRQHGARAPALGLRGCSLAALLGVNRGVVRGRHRRRRRGHLLLWRLWRAFEQRRHGDLLTGAVLYLYNSPGRAATVGGGRG